MLFIPIYALYFHLIFVTLAFVYSFCICFSTHLSTGFNPAFSHLLQWISMRNLQFSTMKKNVQSWQQKKVFLLCDTTVFLNLKDPIQVLGQVSTLFYFLTLPCSDLAPWCPSLQLFPFRCGSGGVGCRLLMSLQAVTTIHSSGAGAEYQHAILSCTADYFPWNICYFFKI